ncbi:hypothetical protein TNCV_1756081 [Trichonephila clavipes]|nr:hypothetical protein TNCV_1756081 [Trichonephila clavipes]
MALYRSLIDCNVVAFIVFEEVRTNDSTSPIKRTKQLPTLSNRSGYQEDDEEDVDGMRCRRLWTVCVEESYLVDDKTDEDEDNNHNESSKGPSNADAFSALETAMKGYEQQSECCPINFCCSSVSETLQRNEVACISILNQLFEIPDDDDDENAKPGGIDGLLLDTLAQALKFEYKLVRAPENYWGKANITQQLDRYDRSHKAEMKLI